MTPFGSYWQSKKIEWQARREAAWKADYAAREADLLTTLKSQESDLVDLIRRQEERKLELAATNDELNTQRRLLEAKASPTNVWAEAFSLGFSKAWDMMLPLMREGFAKTYDVVFAEAVEHTLQGLEATIQKRLDEAEKAHLRPVNELLAKREEFRVKASTAMDATAKTKFEHYVTAIEWALQGTNGH